MNSKFKRVCEVCKRSNWNGRILGPMVVTRTLSAHFNCVLYSPITPDAVHFAPNPEDDAIAGVSSRFIRTEGKRAKELVGFYSLFTDFFLVSVFLSLPHCRSATIAKRMEQTSDVALTSVRIRL